MQVETERPSLLDTPFRALLNLDWERALIIAIVVLGILTRLWDLPYRAWNHDEAIHTDWSWNLYTGRGYQHNPIYHGPLLYHLTAFSFLLFGDNDFSARLANTFLGMVLVALPFFFRKWLGRKGALVTAALLLISPAVMYYSRFNRHDIYVEVFVVLMALAIWKYLDERRERWLFASAAFLSLAFTAMETTFIFVAVFAVFLCAHFTYEFLRPRVKWSSEWLALASAIFGIPVFGVIATYSAVRALTVKTTDEDWREIPSFDLAMIFGTFSIPLITPAVITYLLNPIWMILFATDFLPVSAFSDLSTIMSITQSQPDVMFRVIALTVAMVAFSALLGLTWNARVWGIGAVLFWPLFVVFFTTFFTNGSGFFSGLLGSLGYWLSQQTVQRGGQPSYYYLLVLLPMYEFLPYLFGLGAMFWYWYRYRPVRLVAVLVWMLWIIFYYVAIRPLLLGVAPNLADQLVVAFIMLLAPLTFFATYDSEKPESAFPAFLFVWTAGVLILFSWAGEKMPWLTMHLTIPLAFVTGWALEKLLTADWRDLLARGAVWLALLIPLTTVLFVMLIVSPRPFGGMELNQLSATNAFIIVLFMLIVFVGPAFFAVARRFTATEVARISAVAVLILLTGLTIRFAALAVFIQPDSAQETIIYAQGSHDNVTAMQEIEELSRRLCSQTTPGRTQAVPCDNGAIKVAYDDDSSWPFVWYLRNYRNAQYYGASPNAPFDAPVVIVGSKNEEAVKPWLGSRYTKRTYKLIWWPLEGYKDLNLERVANYFREPQQRLDLFNTWFYHTYKENQSQWPYVHLFSFYVRKDVAALMWNYGGNVPPQPLPEDEYTKKFVRLDAARVLGTPGAGKGQFNYPRVIAFDAQGNMFVADSENHRIQKFDAKGEILLTWGTKSPDGVAPPPGTFNQPWGIAVDKAGNVFVSDTWNHRVQKFDNNGKFLTTWGVNGDTRGVAHDSPLQFYGPRAIMADAQGNVYIADTGNKRVTKFSNTGEPLAQYGGVGSDPGQFLEQVGLAIDKQGNIYVADTWNQRIQKFDANFNFVMQWAVDAWDTQTVVNKPYLAVDGEGNVFASDPEGARIMKFASDGKLLSVFGARGNDLASFNLPTGLAFDAQGNLYVADSGNQRILVFTKP
ncbi:MAG: TIGR03663 family protein [Chloroflexi bacterium]|nr:TIGR03663 family protein [Chloroflexota bacterium]